jgi:hypothetical protein
MTVPGIFDARGMRERQIRTMLHQKLCRSRDVFLLRVCQLIPPLGDSSVFSTFQVINKIFHRGNNVNNYSTKGMSQTTTDP